MKTCNFPSKLAIFSISHVFAPFVKLCGCRFLYFFSDNMNKAIFLIPEHSSLMESALQIRAGQGSITTNLLPLTAHVYHVMIIVTSWFCKKYFFFINLIFISYKFFWTILNLFSWNLNTLTKHKEQVCFLLICSFFPCCYLIILCINTLHLFILFHFVWTHRMNLFSFWLLFHNYSM